MLSLEKAGKGENAFGWYKQGTLSPEENYNDFKV